MATFGLIVCNRSFFPDHVVAAGRKELVDCLAQWGHDSVVLTENETKGGGVETIQDARKCAQLFRENAAKIDGIIISMPNFGDELSVTEVITQAKLNVPILIQASNDQLDKLDLANRRDAFCGKISVCNNFRQCGIKFSLTEKHTCQVNSPEFEADVKKFASVCDVVKGLTNARIAAIGARPDAFHTVRYSEKLLQRSGINVSVVDMSMILHHARSINDQSLIDAKIAEIKEYGNVSNDASPEQIDHEARLSIAIESYVDDNECTSSAVQCWDAVETDYGVATCLPMSMMGMRGKPSACEMDVMGALSMQALLLAGGVPPMLQDWNNNYGSEPDKCINVHCSNFPSCVFEKTPEIGY
ncbi:MAG: fucose isomerase, partial [Eubacteriales bacterium]|nr:fucose isomerase [Eubacteriales bacterium]